MILGEGAFGLILFGLWIFCLIDVITTPEAQMRNLPKIVWILLVLFLVDVGAILWLVAGRSWQPGPRAASRTDRAFPEYDRPGRAVPVNPDDDESFLREIRDRAETQRRAYDAKRRAELQAEQDGLLRKRAEDRDPD